MSIYETLSGEHAGGRSVPGRRLESEGVLKQTSAQLRDLTPYASALHFFGAELRHHRQLAGLSLRRLGPQVFASPSQLRLVEAARRFPSMDLAGRCDSVLNTGGVLARLHPLVSAERAVRLGGSHLPVIARQQVKVLLRLLVDGDPALPGGS
ncbi:hypothetical protein CS0771_56240 [Catellatospora sp. IY07-71]|uniref:helix-turn-helix domain-containing protein n=1 Tax=Catellatospora sp. IY07-71 TaxID=2728827 RepID=UPI001BB37B68|nr:helix-turn-helix transcriptional regulator [Catellatospora sp. IY07-71]BCJ76080.1 hypothetical protein CS0771_56240 [Catellatospora sp. IY07-71]